MPYHSKKKSGAKKKKKARHEERPQAEIRGEAPLMAPPVPAARRDGESISVEETNKLRESLGLKPLRE